MKKIVVVLLILVSMSSCAPLFSEMQGARLIGKNKFEITPGYTFCGYAEKGYREPLAHYVGVQGAYGLSHDVDMRVRFERTWLADAYGSEGDEGSFSTFSIGPKIRIVKDRSALYLPVGMTSGLLQFQPTVLFTIPVVSNKVEFNPIVKHVANLCEGCWQPLVALNAGLAFSTDISRWAIRPEYGVLYNLEGRGRFTNLSIGLSFSLSR